MSPGNRGIERVVEQMRANAAGRRRSMDKARMEALLLRAKQINPTMVSTPMPLLPERLESEGPPPVPPPSSGFRGPPLERTAAGVPPVPKPKPAPWYRRWWAKLRGLERRLVTRRLRHAFHLDYGDLTWRECMSLAELAADAAEAGDSLAGARAEALFYARLAQLKQNARQSKNLPLQTAITLVHLSKLGMTSKEAIEMVESLRPLFKSQRPPSLPIPIPGVPVEK